MTQKKITLNLPWAPSINNYWVGIGKGKGYALKPVARRFREEVRLLWWQSGKPVLTGRLLMRLNMFPPDKRKRDIDNPAKGVLDAMQHAGYFADDNQIDELHIIRRHVEAPGCIQVVLEEIGDGELGL